MTIADAAQGIAWSCLAQPESTLAIYFRGLRIHLLPPTSKLASALTTAPRVQYWDALVTKTGEAMRRDFDYTQQAKKIEASVLLVFADADAIRCEHIVEVLRVFGGGQRDPGWDGSQGRGTAELAIIPGTTHYDLGVSPKMVTAVVPFLDQDLPALACATICHRFPT